MEVAECGTARTAYGMGDPSNPRSNPLRGATKRGDAWWRYMLLVACICDSIFDGLISP